MTARPAAVALAGAIVVDARVAGQLALMLRAARRDAARNGLTLPADLAEVLAVVEQAASVPPPEPPTVPVLASPVSATSGSVSPLQGTDEVARLLGCSPRNVRKAAQRGTLAGRLVGRRWEFSEADVQRWRNRGGAGGRARDDGTGPGGR